MGTVNLCVCVHRRKRKRVKGKDRVKEERERERTIVSEKFTCACRRHSSQSVTIALQEVLISMLAEHQREVGAHKRD